MVIHDEELHHPTFSNCLTSSRRITSFEVSELSCMCIPRFRASAPSHPSLLLFPSSSRTLCTSSAFKSSSASQSSRRLQQLLANFLHVILAICTRQSGGAAPGGSTGRAAKTISTQHSVIWTPSPPSTRQRKSNFSSSSCSLSRTSGILPSRSGCRPTISFKLRGQQHGVPVRTRQTATGGHSSH